MNSRSRGETPKEIGWQASFGHHILHHGIFGTGRMLELEPRRETMRDVINGMRSDLLQGGDWIFLTLGSGEVFCNMRNHRDAITSFSTVVSQSA